MIACPRMLVQLLPAVASGVLALAGAAGTAPGMSATQKAAAPEPQILRVDPRFDALVPPDAVIETLADGFHWVEGPVWDRRQARLLFSDIPANAVLAWSPGGVERVLEKSGYTGDAPFEGREPGSNGLLFDATGRLVLCQHGDRQIARLEPDGSKTAVVSRFRGKRLNSPNDAVYDSRGNLYFTDPPFGLPRAFEDPGKELAWSGVYRLSAAGRLELLTDELRAPNGIALSPDEKILYVANADAARPVWMAYEIGADGKLSRGRVFHDASRWTKGRRGFPDGMKVDRNGNLFASGPEGIYVFAPDGTHLGTLDLKRPTSNCAWGDDGTSLYITADTAIFRVRLATAGAGFPPSTTAREGAAR